MMKQNIEQFKYTSSCRSFLTPRERSGSIIEDLNEQTIKKEPIYQNFKPFQRRNNPGIYERKKLLNRSGETIADGIDSFDGETLEDTLSVKKQLSKLALNEQKIIKSPTLRNRRPGTERFKRPDDMLSTMEAQKDSINNSFGLSNEQLLNEEIKLVKELNSVLQKKNKQLIEENKYLRDQNQRIKVENQFIIQQCTKKQEKINKIIEEHQREIAQQDRLHHCLEETITHLNLIIDGMNEEKKMSKNCGIFIQGQERMIEDENVHLKMYVTDLRQQLFRLQVENDMLRRKDFEVYKTKEKVFQLENQNSILNFRLQNLLRAKKPIKTKSQGTLTEDLSELEYSFQFEFEE